MAPLAVVMLLAAAQPVRLVAPAFMASGIEREAARAWADYLVQQLTNRGLVIQTEGDIAAALGAERQRQLMGCGDESCIAEIAGALGSDGLLLGSVARADATRVINLRVISKVGQPLATASMTVANEGGVFDALAVLARELVTQLRPKFELDRIPPEQGRLKKTHALVPSLAAGVLGGIGVLIVQSALGTERGIREGMPPFGSAAELDAAVAGGRRLEATGWVLIGIGAVSLVVAIAVLFLGDPP